MAISEKILKAPPSAGGAGPTPSDHFGTVLYTGTGSAQSINGGKFGPAASFNGSSSKIALANNCFNFSAITVSVWVKPSGSGYRVIFENYNYTGSPGSQGIIFRIDNSNDKALLRAYNGDCSAPYPTDGSCANATEVYSNSAISTSAWTHIAFTLDSSNMKMYVNGTAQTGNTSVASNGFSFNASALTNIGYLKYGSAADEQFYSGLMDHMRVYNSVLSATEITELYNETLADSYKVDFPTGKTVKALYRLNGDANDETGVYDGTATNVTWNYGVNFTPDMVWLKKRNASKDHQIYDTVRGIGSLGGGNTLYPNGTWAQSTNADTNYFRSFDSGGFTLGGNDYTNGSSQTYVAWCWNAGGSTVTNDTGSRDTQVRANTAAGFSIVSLDKPNTNTDTYGHGLDSAPEMIILKRTASSDDWYVYHKDLGNTVRVSLNSNAAKVTGTGVWASTTPTSSVFTLQNQTGGAHIAYCFHDVDSYQKIGSYTGNGSPNGPIVETGFEPAFIIFKRTDATNGWGIADNTRNTSNPRTGVLQPHNDDQEYTSNDYAIDFLSDGFQIKNDDNGWNTSGGTYIYMAMAADPETITPVLAKSFKISTYTGDKPNDKTITDVGFSPSLVWTKNRDSIDSHSLFDAVRGEYALSSNSNNSESDFVGYFNFNSNGFTVGNSGQINESGDDFVAWSWKASDSTEILTAGSIDSTASINDEAGFSIVKYTGNGTNGATVAHGLSNVPNFILIKNLDTNKEWMAWHGSNSGELGYLDNDAVFLSSRLSWAFNGTQPSTSLVTIGGTSNDSYTNGSGDNYIMYCWRAITSYSKFGTYNSTGATGSSNTITTGFQPDFLLVKSTEDAEDWYIFDSERINVSGSNDGLIFANTNAVENTGYDRITFTSTGFYWNTAYGGNSDGYTYIYAAFKMN